MTQPEALRLANSLAAHSLSRHGQTQAAAELRRLHAERAAADGVINDLVAKVRELQKENTSLSAALASSCDEQRHELWESGGIAGCERARVAERQRDALQEANEAFGKRQEWWNEKMFTLEAQRDALLAEHQQTLALQQRSYEREIQLEVEAEREACAKLAESTVCDTHLPTGVRIYGTLAAAAIRARTP